MAEGFPRSGEASPSGIDIQDPMKAGPASTRQQGTRDPPPTSSVRPPPEGEKERRRRISKLLRRHLLLLATAMGLLVVGVRYGVPYYQYAVSHEWTDSAFIDGHIIAISSNVPGQIRQVHVTDNQQVQKGALLVEIDASDYRARLRQAEATLQAAIAKHEAAQSNVELTLLTTEAGVQQASAGLAIAQAALQTAHRQVAVARARVGQAQAQVETALANAAQARAQVMAAEAEARIDEARGRLVAAQAGPHEVGVSRAQAQSAHADVEQARAAVTRAELALSYTQIQAPEPGRVTRKAVEEGAYVQAGQTLMAIVPAHVWVVANFKETQLTHMRPGQPAEITVDAYPGVRFQGRVDSLQSGTGARFSLLPPENATGNFVKVVQRVPVKIVLDDPPDAHCLLAPGMSVVPVVKVK